eukprot:51058-Eustigmatos_ZCMA.PRE.1
MGAHAVPFRDHRLVTVVVWWLVVVVAVLMEIASEGCDAGGSHDGSGDRPAVGRRWREGW